MIWCLKNRKKRRVFFCILCCIFISLYIVFSCVLTVNATAENTRNLLGETGLEDTIKEQIGELDLTALEEYIAGIKGFSGGSLTNRLLDYIKGANFNYKSFSKEILMVLFSQIAQLFPAFACIMAIALLVGLLAILKSGTLGGTVSKLMGALSYVAVLIPLIAILTTCLSDSLDAINSINKQMYVLFPLILTLLTASGGGATAAVCRSSVSFLSTAICSILTDVVFPITIIIMTFSMAANFTSDLKLNKFTALFKSLNKWIIGISISVFGLFFTLQGITAASYDGVVRRAAKYVIGNGVPIVGGFLSGGFDLAIAGSVLIKNSLGSMGIFLMVSVVFEPLTLLIAVTILLRLTAAATQPLGDGQISNILGETADNLRYATACLLLIAFLYFLAIMVMVYCTEALF